MNVKVIYTKSNCIQLQKKKAIKNVSCLSWSLDTKLIKMLKTFEEYNYGENVRSFPV